MDLVIFFLFTGNYDVEAERYYTSKGIEIWLTLTAMWFLYRDNLKSEMMEIRTIKSSQLMHQYNNNIARSQITVERKNFTSDMDSDLGIKVKTTYYDSSQRDGDLKA